MVTAIREDRVYLTQRLARWFWDIAYDAPNPPFVESSCESLAVLCLRPLLGMSFDPGERLIHPTLFASGLLKLLHQHGQGGVFSRSGASPSRREPPAGVLICHMDMWLQPALLNRLPLNPALLWRLAPGLNRSPKSPPQTHVFRVLSKRCVHVADIAQAFACMARPTALATQCGFVATEPADIIYG